MADLSSSKVWGDLTVSRNITTMGAVTGTSFNSITGLSSTSPNMDGIATVGTGTTTARADHIHPTDTSRAATNQTMYIGTTSVAINRTSASLALTGITSIDGSAATATTATNVSGGTVSATTGTFSGAITGTSFNSITGLSSTTPAANGTAAIGTSTTAARADHVHPTDTSRAPLASPTFTGSVTAGDSLMVSTNAAVAAAGTTQATGTILTKDLNVVTSATAGTATGVVLPTGVAGRGIRIANNTVVALSVYPAVGGYIDSLAQNAAFTLPANAQIVLYAISATNWESSVYTVQDWSKITNIPTTIAGYGISDALSTSGTAASATKLAVARTIATSGDATGTATSFDGTANITIPLTLANSGATAGTYNNVTVNAKGLVTSGSNTAYLTANQTITLSGDVTGSGTTTITTTLANSGVTAGTYKSVTVDVKGRVTGGTNPTTLAGYGITDAALLASPALTGTPTAPTAVANTNTTQLATTAFVLGQASSTTPNMDGTATIGTGTTFARADHVHPSDTSRAALASPTFTGIVTLPTNSISDSLLLSLNSAVAAAGTTQGTATTLTKDINIVTGGTGGVVVQGATTGKVVVIGNRTGSAINVYPASGHYFDGLAINIPISLPANGFLELYGFSTTQWITSFTAVTDWGKIQNIGYEASSANIKMDGTANVGSLNTIARADHIHPTDTSRAPLASPTFAGSVTSPMFVSSVATGTAPLTVASTTMNTNLNVDFIHGHRFYVESVDPTGSYTVSTNDIWFDITSMTIKLKTASGWTAFSGVYA